MTCGASLTLVKEIVAAAELLVEKPSLTTTLYEGGNSPSSCTNCTAPSITCCCVKLVIGVPGLLSSSNLPCCTLEIVNVKSVSAVSGSCALNRVVVKTTV